MWGNILAFSLGDDILETVLSVWNSPGGHQFECTTCNCVLSCIVTYNDLVMVTEQAGYGQNMIALWQSVHLFNKQREWLTAIA